MGSNRVNGDDLRTGDAGTLGVPLSTRPEPGGTYTTSMGKR